MNFRDKNFSIGDRVKIDTSFEHWAAGQTGIIDIPPKSSMGLFKDWTGNFVTKYIKGEEIKMYWIRFDHPINLDGEKIICSALEVDEKYIIELK